MRMKCHQSVYRYSPEGVIGVAVLMFVAGLVIGSVISILWIIH